MKLEEVFSYLPEDIFKPDVNSVQTYQELSKENLDISGDNEIGYYKEINENYHILSNDRVDSMVYIIDKPEIYAIQIVHYHRRGQMYGVKVYK
jgi:hypothetical protein